MSYPRLTSHQTKSLIRAIAFNKCTEEQSDSVLNDLITGCSSITPGTAWSEFEIEAFVLQHLDEINTIAISLDRWLSGHDDDNS